MLLPGYEPLVERPKYRHITGVLRVWNPYHGYQPLYMQNAEMAQKISTAPISQSIAELEALVTGHKSGALIMQMPQGMAQMLMNAMEVALEPSVHVSITDIVGVLDTVRNNVLLWALELEKKGIVGNGLTFSREEQQKATKVTYQITNHIGSMTNSQLQQHSSGHQTINIENDLESLRLVLVDISDKLSELQLRSDIENEVRADLATLFAQVSSPKPKSRIVTESLQSVRNVLEGAAGNLVASGLLLRLNEITTAIGLG